MTSRQKNHALRIMSAFFNTTITGFSCEPGQGTSVYFCENGEQITHNCRNRNHDETERALWRIVKAALDPNFSVVESNIQWMNETFELPSNDTPTDLGVLRLYEIESVLHEELCEIRKARESESVDRLVHLADLLGDLKVFIESEARRWGIPLLSVFHIIMDSQESKLVNGKPLKSPDGSKFIKGPNYLPPEDRIRELIVSRINNNNDAVTRGVSDIQNTAGD